MESHSLTVRMSMDRAPYRIGRKILDDSAGAFLILLKSHWTR